MLTRFVPADGNVLAGAGEGMRETHGNAVAAARETSQD
jgi:hypothetical protein